MGRYEKSMGMLTGMGNLKAPAGEQAGAKQWDASKAIIGSMTPDERRKQHIINAVAEADRRSRRQSSRGSEPAG